MRPIEVMVPAQPRKKRWRVETGDVFGRLTVVGRSGWDDRRNQILEVLCTCGASKRVRSDHLRSGASRSCGCLSKEKTAARSLKHGATKSRGMTSTYKTWESMKWRCRDLTVEHYGAKGIRVCLRWVGPDGFENFLADMGERPAGKTLDRIDGRGNYEPGNCRWATPTEQAKNRAPRRRR